MKKAELRQGVAYYVSSRDNYGWSSSVSAFKLHKDNSANRRYVVFRDGEPDTSYRSQSVIYMTTCKTYGADCPTHQPKEEGKRFTCYIERYRLMDIRGEYWATIKRFLERNKQNAQSKDIRAARLARIAKRNKEAVEKPIKEEFFAVLSQITNSYVSYYDKIGEFTPQEMLLITNAIKAGMPSVKAVAS